MRRRCEKRYDTSYKDYGGRGITYAPRWKAFAEFLADMGERPLGMTLDRIDNDGPYCRENCRWATRGEQANNKRNNHLIEYVGLSYTAAQWSRITGFRVQTILSRLRLGWSTERTLTEPIKTKTGLRYSAVLPRSVAASLAAGALS
jgi:hypothetical protein